ncbi:hypothetical protein N0V90_012136 [Kalmusia sp. IMI 367209]|nr:hypothetical protein N0V90_012136 [Kalmusia sp. IMI 367209]
MFDFDTDITKVFEDDPATAPSTSQTTDLYHVLLQSTNMQLEILGQRMSRIESALDRILDHLHLPHVNEEPQKFDSLNRTQPHLPNTDPASTSFTDQGFQEQQGPLVDGSLLQSPEVLDGTYLYTTLEPSKSQIRILEIQPAANFTDPIIVELKVFSLDNDNYENYTSFTALSYCWGPPVMDHSIILGGYHFPITQSLDSALRHLRNKFGHRVFNHATGKMSNDACWWIDQICINQADIDERGSQVSLMRRIYKRATGVHIWLGDESDDSSKALDVLTTLGAPPTHAPGEKTIHYPSFSKLEIENHWKALRALFKRPWFERVWIRQEIALHYNVVLSCGDKTLDMSILAPALFTLHYVKNLGYEGPVEKRDTALDGATLPWDYHPWKLADLRECTNFGYSWVGLSKLLLNSRGCKATDPRDTVFSVLGLADPEVYPILPDYRQDLREVYIAAAEQAVRREDGIDLLAACQNPQRKRGLPSWVPNLADPWQTIPFNRNDIQGKSKLSAYEMTSKLVPDVQIQDGILILRGGLLDEVKSISPDAVSEGSTATQLEEVYTSWRTFVDNAARLQELEDLEAYEYVEETDQVTLLHWIRFLSILHDDAQDLRRGSQRNHAWAPNHSDPSGIEELDFGNNPWHHLGLNSKLARSYLLPPNYSIAHLHSNHRVHKAMLTNCVGRRLCITKRGMVALVPAEAEVGNPIALFQGASFPYILGPVDEDGNHVLVGEAFVPRYTSRGGERLVEDEWEHEFRNLKFATIPGRWQDSTLNDTLTHDTNGVYDAAHFGPSCPHLRGAQAWDLTLTGNIQMPFGEGHITNEEPMNELECLHVNVTVPKAVLRKREGKGLPVFVWVHGGGLSMGSNNWPQYNLTRFVERSVESGKPVIGVAINYRVGILGFLASKELGIDGNFGYKDQVLAFRWIKKHIAGFGGNPDDITASGESAGGISLSTLLCVNVGNEALFERVVIMSGDATLRKSRIRSWHENLYHVNLKYLGLEKAGVEERKRQLKEMDAEALTSKLPLAQHFCACVDGDFLEENISLTLMSDGKRKQHKPDWCQEFVVGSTAHDGTILHGRVLINPAVFDLLKSSCTHHLSSSETSALFSAYDLPAASPEQELRNLTELITDLRFYVPTVATHSGWKAAFSPNRSARYHFHVPNPIEGTFTGLATHELDVAFLLQNYFEHLDESSKRVARQMTDQWIGYTNGNGWCEEGKIIVIEAGGLSKVNETDYDRQFRRGRSQVLERIGVEKCWRLAEEWQGVRPEESEHDIKGRL